MVKRFVLAVLFIILLAVNSTAAKFSWDSTPEVCCPDCKCETWIWTWEAWRYADACPEDTKITTEDWPVDIPAVCIDRLKALPVAKIRVTPPGWITNSFEILKANAPMLESNRSYVSVGLFCEDYDKICSDPSNRVLWKTPRPIDPFGIKIVP